MPIYEYEPTDHECQICPGRFEALQAASEEALTHCPTCGLPVRRVVSNVQFSTRTDKVDYDKAARKGFTTYRKAESGTYEKIAGEGADILKDKR